MMTNEITEADARAAIAKTGHARYEFLCFEHDDVRTRACQQAVVLKRCIRGRVPSGPEQVHASG